MSRSGIGNIKVTLPVYMTDALSGESQNQQNTTLSAEAMKATRNVTQSTTARSQKRKRAPLPDQNESNCTDTASDAVAGGAPVCLSKPPFHKNSVAAATAMDADKCEVLDDLELDCSESIEELDFECKCSFTNCNCASDASELRAAKKLKSQCEQIFSLADVIDSENDDELLTNMLEREKVYQPNSDYLHQQAHIDCLMRAILLDWMMEVGQEFSLGRETLYLAMNYVDRYLSVVADVPRSDLQLLGVSSLFIAAKLEEIYPPRASDFAITTDGAYDVQQIYTMERTILSTLNWLLAAQTPYSWLKFYCKRAASWLHSELEKRLPVENILPAYSMMDMLASTELFTVCMITLDSALHDIDSLDFPPSQLAAAALAYVLPATLPIIAAICPYDEESLLLCMALLYSFSSVPAPPSSQPTKCYFDIKLLPEDVHTRQTHNPFTLEHVKRMLAQDAPPSSSSSGGTTAAHTIISEPS